MTEPGRARRDVVVVGGGLAGLTAAWNLRQRDVVLLESGPRAGGRVFSVPRDPYWLNLGAGVFSAKASPVRELVSEMGLETRAIPGSTTALALDNRILKTGRLETYPLRLPLSTSARYSLIRAGMRIRVAVAKYHRLARAQAGDSADDAERRVAAFEGDRSLAEFLGPLHPDVDAIIRATAANRIGTELETISANGGLGSFAYQWSGDANVLNHTLIGGSGLLPEALASRLGNRVKLGATVLSIEERRDDVKVTFRTGGEKHSVSAEAVIVATPADITRDIVKRLPSPLDGALSQIRYGSAVLASILTDEKGPMPYDDIYALITPKRATTVFINVANALRGPGERVDGGSLIVYRGGNEASELMNSSDSHIEESMLEGLYDVFPAARGIVSEVIVQRWKRLVPITHVGRYHIQDALESPMRRVFLAGDYLGSWGNMEAAATSAIRAAASARAVLGGKT